MCEFVFYFCSTLVRRWRHGEGWSFILSVSVDTGALLGGVERCSWIYICLELVGFKLAIDIDRSQCKLLLSFHLAAFLSMFFFRWSHLVLISFISELSFQYIVSIYVLKVFPKNVVLFANVTIYSY